MSIIRYGGTSGGYRTIKQFGRDPFLGYTLEDLAQLVKGAGGVLYLDARKADGVQKGVNAPFTNPLIDLTQNSNNATLTNFAQNNSDGYTLEATVNSNGQAVGYENLLLNANLVDANANGLADDWIESITTNRACANGVQTFTATAQYGRVQQAINVVAGQKYYIEASCKCASASVQLSCYNVSATIGQKTLVTLNSFEKLGIVVTAIATGLLYIQIGDIRASGWTPIEFTTPMIQRLDVPQITAFETQLGKPLDAPACDRIFPFVPTTGVTYVSARPYIATDGLDSYGVLANNSSVDIVGTEDFAINWCGITPSVLQNGSITSKATSVITDAQFAILIGSDGVLSARLNGGILILGAVGTIKTNTQTKIEVERKDGRLKCWLNDVLIYDQPNTTSLISSPNFRMFAISSNSSGTTHQLYLKGLTAYLILARGTYGDLDKLDGVLDRVSKDYR